jgi:hypothetical protein
MENYLEYRGSMTGLALVVTFLTEVINDRVGSENSTFAPLTAAYSKPVDFGLRCKWKVH